MLPPLSEAQIINSLTFTNVYWRESAITYSIPNLNSNWSGYSQGSEPYLPDFKVFNSTQAENFRLVMEDISKLIAKPIVETNDISNTGNIRVAFTTIVEYSAHAYFPPEGGVASQASGDIWLHSNFSQYSLNKDAGQSEGGAYGVFLHEIGHALGLGHVHEGEFALPKEWSTTQYTVMSYNGVKEYIAFNFSLDSSGIEFSRNFEIAYINKPMVYDILALQKLYGANNSTASGNSIYTWNQDKSYYDAIYDAGGVDVIDLSDHSRGSKIDLTPGSYSSIDYYSVEDQKIYWGNKFPQHKIDIDRAYSQTESGAVYEWRNNVGIAYGVTIENVDAGFGNDVVKGNIAANNLSGNAGQDSIDGAEGNDLISGGAGEDTLWGGEGNDSIDGGADFDKINGNVGNDTAYGGEGGDWVVGGKDNDVLHGENGADVVNGNLGDDTCNGGADADWVRGGQGDDVLDGGAGNDWLSGDRGNDAVTGGAGADTFYFFAGSAVDRVTDFSSAAGDRVLLDPGQAYTLSYTAEGAVVSLGAGDQIILMGITQASIGDWLHI